MAADKIIKRGTKGLGAITVTADLNGREFTAKVELTEPRRVIALHRVAWIPHYSDPMRREQETFRSVSANHKSRAKLDARILELLKDEPTMVQA